MPSPLQQPDQHVGRCVYPTHRRIPFRLTVRRVHTSTGLYSNLTPSGRSIPVGLATDPVRSIDFITQWLVCACVCAHTCGRIHVHARGLTLILPPISCRWAVVHPHVHHLSDSPARPQSEKHPLHTACLQSMAWLSHRRPALLTQSAAPSPRTAPNSLTVHGRPQLLVLNRVGLLFLDANPNARSELMHNLGLQAPLPHRPCVP